MSSKKGKIEHIRIKIPTNKPLFVILGLVICIFLSFCGGGLVTSTLNQLSFKNEIVDGELFNKIANEVANNKVITTKFSPDVNTTPIIIPASPYPTKVTDPLVKCHVSSGPCKDQYAVMTTSICKSSNKPYDCCVLNGESPYLEFKDVCKAKIAIKSADRIKKLQEQIKEYISNTEKLALLKTQMQSLNNDLSNYKDQINGSNALLDSLTQETILSIREIEDNAVNPHVKEFQDYTRKNLYDMCVDVVKSKYESRESVRLELSQTNIFKQYNNELSGCTSLLSY